MYSGQRGISTVYALIIMAVLIIITAGLLPAANSMLKMTKIDQDGEIAQAAAESVAKHFISSLYNGEVKSQEDLHNWKNNQLSSSINSGATASISNFHDTTTQYIFDSTGSYKNSRRSVRVTVSYKKDNVSPPLVDFSQHQIMAFSPHEINIGAFIDGGKVFSNANSGIYVNFLHMNLDSSFIKRILGLPDDSYVTANGRYKQNLLIIPTTKNCLTPASLSFPPNVAMNKRANDFDKNYQDLNMDWKKTELGYNAAKKTFSPNVDLLLMPGCYKFDGNLDLRGSLLDIRTLTIGSPGGVILHITGNLTVENYARIGFFLQNLADDFSLGPDRSKYMLIIVDGNVTIRSQSGANYATIISYGKIDAGNNVNIGGSIQALKGIEISQNILDYLPVNLYYEARAVRPFRQILTEINTPYGDTSIKNFKIDKWENIKNN